jgi:hypothetical protein
VKYSSLGATFEDVISLDEVVRRGREALDAEPGRFDELWHGSETREVLTHSRMPTLVYRLPWTPGLQDQAEDRAYRNGQLRMVVVKIPLVENTIDQMLWQMLLDKRQLTQDLIEPDLATAQRAELSAHL